MVKEFNILITGVGGQGVILMSELLGRAAVADGLRVRGSEILRMAFFLEYFPILISDAVNYLGPAFTLEATTFIVKLLFGWVTDSKEFCRSLTAKSSSKQY